MGMMDKNVETLSGDISRKISRLIYRRVTTVVTEKDSNRYVAISNSPLSTIGHKEICVSLCTNCMVVLFT